MTCGQAVRVTKNVRPARVAWLAQTGSTAAAGTTGTIGPQRLLKNFRNASAAASRELSADFFVAAGRMHGLVWDSLTAWIARLLLDFEDRPAWEMPDPDPATSVGGLE